MHEHTNSLIEIFKNVVHKAQTVRAKNHLSFTCYTWINDWKIDISDCVVNVWNCSLGNGSGSPTSSQLPASVIILRQLKKRVNETQHMIGYRWTSITVQTLLLFRPGISHVMLVLLGAHTLHGHAFTFRHKIIQLCSFIRISFCPLNPLSVFFTLSIDHGCVICIEYKWKRLYHSAV